MMPLIFNTKQNKKHNCAFFTIMKNKYLFLSVLLLTSCSSSTELTSKNIQTINYKTFVDSIYNMQENEKIIAIFTQTSCSHCHAMYPYLNKYLNNYTDSSITFYNISLDTKNGKFVDEYLGNVDGSENDFAKKLDIRLQQWANRVNQDDLSYLGEGTYSYLSTPLILWYDNKIEVKVSNRFQEIVNDYSSFESFMQFPEEYPTFNVEFNLTYNKNVAN